MLFSILAINTLKPLPVIVLQLLQQITSILSNNHYYPRPMGGHELERIRVHSTGNNAHQYKTKLHSRTLTAPMKNFRTAKTDS